MHMSIDMVCVVTRWWRHIVSKRKEKKRPIMGCIGCHLVVVMGCRMHHELFYLAPVVSDLLGVGHTFMQLGWAHHHQLHLHSSWEFTIITNILCINIYI